ncbi:hypothetical protein BTUL_0121g00200 [Botrytis tulipae]|uniref:Uncharacterized protein n=1 Tax=Botrytis tulipae TaxID=87230 RepID=A0A4Z1EPL5_9HELO|nr:hypothetical protein BTUL_0121g00200 [Botrytis tulipae]
MTSNKNKRSTPHKSPHKSSPHKHHKQGKAHKSPKENVAPAKPNLPILPQKNSEIIPPILPPTRRILFSQSLKKSNSQQPFLSPHAIKIDHQKTKKHTLSSPAAKFTDDRPLNKPCLSSPSPAKRTKLLPVTPERVNGRERTIPSSDDEDENEIGESTPNPPSRKRKSNAMASAAGSHKKTPPPKTSVAVVIPTKQKPSSSFSTIHPNSPAVQKIDISVLRLEKEELQHRLDVSSQQAQKAMNEVQEWENRYRETTDNWEDKWKEAASEIDVLRKRLDSKTKTQKGDEPTTDKWRLRYISKNEETIKLQRELKQIKNAPEPLHLTEKIENLELELPNLKSQHHLPKTDQQNPPEEHLESPNPHLAEQITQLRPELQEKDLLITNLTTQNQTLHQELSQKAHLSSQVTQLTSSLSFTHDLLSQAERTYHFESTALKQQITHLKKLLISQTKISEEFTTLQKETQKMREEMRGEILDRDEEIVILRAEFEEERKGMRREVESEWTKVCIHDRSS